MNTLYDEIEKLAFDRLDQFIKGKGGRDMFNKTKSDASCSYEWDQIDEIVTIYDWKHSTYKNKLKDLILLREQDKKSDFDIYKLTDKSLDQVNLSIKLMNFEKEFDKEKFKMTERLLYVSRAFKLNSEI